MPEIQYYGIRHHGPGSARSLIAELQKNLPDIILVEGPSEAEVVLPLLFDSITKLPVALLIYASDDPQQASYFPFARFSPEYQSLLFAHNNGIPVRFMDLPQSKMIPLRQQDQLAAIQRMTDPLSELAKAGGYDDAERWWNAMVEQQQDTNLFDVIHDAMTALREHSSEKHMLETLREAYMRQTIHHAMQEGFQNIAVVCGAWHTPGLKDVSFTGHDQQLLDELESIPVSVTWIPWTYSRLSRESGYGAGVLSPGWYRFLWENEDVQKLSIEWLTKVAQHLREQDLSASTAQVIDAVRLAELLTGLRGRALPDLQDLNEAAISVLCFGNPAPMTIIHRDLIVGKAMGRVPDDVPTVPLQCDFYAQVDAFELLIDEEESELFLDFREELEREISRFLHRLNFLDIQWATLEEADLLYELWILQWHPESIIQLIEKSAWGNTIVQASAALAVHQGQVLSSIPELSLLIERVLFADLASVVPAIVQRLENEASTVGDLTQLMEALPALVNALLYGDTRRTFQQSLRRVIDSMAVRITIGLPGECIALDDDNAIKMLDASIRCNVALRSLGDANLLEAWLVCLHNMSDSDRIHPLIRGRCIRILMDTRNIDKEEATRQMKLALARVVPAGEAASWVRGFVQGSASVLIHDDTMLSVIDAWLSSLPADDFELISPLLRRTFADFETPEIDRIGRRLEGRDILKVRLQARELDSKRANQVDATLNDLLGLDDDDK